MSRYQIALQCFVALSASAICDVNATEQTDVCAEFLHQYRTSVADANTSITKVLCFEWFSKCGDGDIIAEQFWKLENSHKPRLLRNKLLTSSEWTAVVDQNTRNQDDTRGRAISKEAAALRARLVSDPPDYAEVKEIPLQNGRVSLIRIASRHGTAGCESDIYMQRTPQGYKLFREATLDGFSAEATSCGTGSIWFAPYKTMDYVARYFYNRLDVYLIDKKLKLSHVCTVEE
jgi:hypothetical protein